ncbi:MAG: hypothetical protein V3V78_01795 [Candidatus Woesearchaeota archaeon]
MAKFFGKVAPLPGSFMMASIIGFLVSAYLITDISWKFTMLLFFAVMFIASFISMTQAPVIEEKKK